MPIKMLKKKLQKITSLVINLEGYKNMAKRKILKTMRNYLLSIMIMVNLIYDCSLRVYRNIIDCCILVCIFCIFLYILNHIKLSDQFLYIFGDSSRLFTLSENKDCLNFPWQSGCLYFFFLPYCTGQTHQYNFEQKQ